jgi:hypothetical protein
MCRRSRFVHRVAVLGGIALAVFGTPALPVHAAAPSWNGKYSLVRYAVDKTGSSVAAGQAEQPSHYTWDGTRWVEHFDFQWDCYMGEGVPKVWSPARSWAFYAPQSDGSLRGTWHTDISSGPCRGSVEMPVAAFAARAG